jgi:hypothetical protein
MRNLPQDSTTMIRTDLFVFTDDIGKKFLVDLGIITALLKIYSVYLSGFDFLRRILWINLIAESLASPLLHDYVL